MGSANTGEGSLNRGTGRRLREVFREMRQRRETEVKETELRETDKEEIYDRLEEFPGKI
ncbi:hypothetical protein C8R41DRAFT_854905 [Lentinula lateritia]|uniref:Uncharacterized protein n=1 Tax=Lentinula lateritia TaxID=40482 RepID=A0ABQ8V1I6_9AGAR|nr:hypothetical protein C8R41DRAFT_854905 [Lentinula lateritia]